MYYRHLENRPYLSDFYEPVYRANSAVARVSCALGQEIFLHPSSTKTTEFEVKNRCKCAEEAKAELVLQLYHASAIILHSFERC